MKQSKPLAAFLSALFAIIIMVAILIFLQEIQEKHHKDHIAYLTSLFGEEGAKCFVGAPGETPPCLIRYASKEVGLVVRVEDKLFLARYKIPMQPLTYEELAELINRKTFRLIPFSSVDWQRAGQDLLAPTPGH